MDSPLKTKDRLEFIDVAKGIGMIFVVFAHVNYTPELLVLIYSWHMPLFFIISGMLFNGSRFRNFGDFLRRRLRTLMLPYLIYSLSSLVYLFVSERMFPEVFDITREKYLSYFAQIFLAQRSGSILDVPLWFVPCLFAVEIGYYFISKLDKKITVPLVTALAALGWLLQSGIPGFDSEKIPWTLDSGLFALSFYAFGNLSFPLLKRVVVYIRSQKYAKIICLETLLISGILWLPLTLINGKVTLGSRTLNNPILLFMTGVLGTAMVFALSLLFERCRFLKFLGRNSFTVMAVHYMIRRYTVPKIYHSLGYELYDRKVFSETAVPFLIVFALSLGFAWVLARVTAVYRKRKAL